MIKYIYIQKIHIKKYQFLINKRENTALKYFNDPKAFTECSNDMFIEILKNTI